MVFLSFKSLFFPGINPMEGNENLYGLRCNHGSKTMQNVLWGLKECSSELTSHSRNYREPKEKHTSWLLTQQFSLNDFYTLWKWIHSIKENNSKPSFNISYMVLTCLTVWFNWPSPYRVFSSHPQWQHVSRFISILTWLHTSVHYCSLFTNLSLTSDSQLENHYTFFKV